MLKLNLEWKILDRDHVALIFDKTTFAAFQSIADARGLDTQNMISEALARLLGTPVATRTGR
jgi:hypothetical protein